MISRGKKFFRRLITYENVFVIPTIVIRAQYVFFKISFATKKKYQERNMQKQKKNRRKRK